MTREPTRISARAFLLGERLEHRALARSDAPLVDPVLLLAPTGVTAFAFRWGVLVLFGADAAQEAAMVSRLRAHVSAPLATPVEESARIVLGADQDGIDPHGVIALQDDSLPRLALVADALAKSAALSQQEGRMAETLDWMEPVIAELQGRGRLAVGSRRLLRRIGAALSARSRTAVRVEASDKPDLLWDHPELERLYARLADEFELRERSAALDRKLALIADTSETLLSLIQARRSLVLEAAIVVLVGIEVINTLYETFFR